MSEPIRTPKNEYRGVNPHLNSLIQTPGSKEFGPAIFRSFHVEYIANLNNFLNQQLPERYSARLEQSLQISLEELPQATLSGTRRPVPDVTIYGGASGGQPATSAVLASAPEWVAEFEAALDWDEDTFVPSVVVRDTQDNPTFGRILVRVEMLSPSNMPGRSGYPTYRKSRTDALFSGTPLIELHYLHEFMTPIPAYPQYPSEPNSHAYNILVSDPRESVRRVAGYGFDVDSPFPVVPVPLLGDETLTFDFGAVYHFTFNTGRWGKHVDYAAFPLRFETYSPADQERIRQRMTTVTQAQAQP